MTCALVIDDDPLVRGAIRAWLEDKNITVVAAEGGLAGLKAVSETQFDVVLVDIFMPGMDGLESIGTIHKEVPGVPIIAMSGRQFSERAGPAPDFLKMALALGATRCLKKPFTPKALLEAVADCRTLSRPDTTARKI